MMKTLRISLSIAALAAVIGFAGTASAFTIDCATRGDGCVGGTYTLEITETAPDLYLAKLTIDTSGAFKVAATDLVDIEFKAANDYTNPMIVSGEPGSVVDGPLSGQGCKGKNDSFICIDLSPDLTVGGIYTWEVKFGASALLAEDEMHIGARYTGVDKETGWVISEGPGAAVPEPGAALLFGAGILLAGHQSRRRQREA
jgi:hypothetical protein